MTYLNRKRKDGKQQEIRCRSGRDIADQDAMVVRIAQPGVAALTEREKKLNREKP